MSYRHDMPKEIDEISAYPNAEYSSNWWGNWAKYPYEVDKPEESTSGSLAWVNWPLYTVGLVVRGFSDDDIAKIQGQNFLRVLKANEI